MSQYFVRVGLSSVFFMAVVFGVACSHKPAMPDASTARKPSSEEAPKSDLTIWKLQEMAQSGRFDELNALFNKGLNMPSLPVGYAAGAGARVLGAPVKFLDTFTGFNWRGKIFWKSGDPRSSKGLNRIKRVLGVASAPITPMGAFTTQLLDKHAYVPQATSNMVVLNYAKPVTEGYHQERILQVIQVYDLMVAVPGKYGPVYIGKTWLGRYDKTGEFKAINPNNLIAWFFLDFNQAALDEQFAAHWDKSEEVAVDYTK